MFNFLKRKELHKSGNVIENKVKEEEELNFALYLLFSNSFEINKDAIIKRINSINVAKKLKIKLEAVDDSHVKDSLYLNMVINNHKFKLIGLDAPLPENIVRRTIRCGHGRKDELARMEENKYYVIAFYEGNSKDMNKIFNAYSKLAYGFLEHNLLGLVNGYNWNALTPSLIKRIAEEDSAKELANTAAIMLWRNLIKIPYKDGVWFVTKGNNLYDVYEFAYFGTIEEAKEVYDIFENEFKYVYETKAHITVGEVIKIKDNEYLRFREVYELEEVLQGDGIGTLVIEKIKSGETLLNIKEYSKKGDMKL